MKRNSMWASLALILALTAGALAALLLGQGPQFGLDLQGGVSAVYRPVFEEGEEPEDLDETLEQTISIIRQRVDSLGVAEPEIARVGTDINVQLPGITEADRANEVIGRTAQLAFNPVVGTLAPGTPQYDETPPCIQQLDNGTWVPSPERPTFAEHGVVCAADLGPSLDPDALDPVEPATPSPGASETASPAATATATPTPTEEPTSAGAGTAPAPVVAAQDGEVTPAATPGGTESPTPAATPGEDATLSPEDLDEFFQGLEFNDGLPVDAPRPIKYVLDEPPVVDGDELTGADITDATAGLSTGGYAVTLEFDADGQEGFRIATAQAACERDDPGLGRPGLVAIVLDELVESAPSMNPDVQCGVGLESGAQITTGSEEDAIDLALVLSAGSLPVTLEPTTFTTVSPTLGASSLRNGVLAGFVGLVLVALYLLWFYRGLGLVAIGALAVFGLLVYGTITLMGQFGFALTLAGVAGIIVSVGITADSSIIYFERIRDEVAVGKTTRLAVARGFTSAFRTNLAGNTVTLVAAAILYLMAVGPVRGFAFTLGLATLLDLFIMWAWTRSTIGLLTMRGRLGPSIRRRQAAAVPATGSTQGGAA